MREGTYSTKIEICVEGECNDHDILVSYEYEPAERELSPSLASSGRPGHGHSISIYLVELERGNGKYVSLPLCLIPKNAMLTWIDAIEAELLSETP